MGTADLAGLAENDNIPDVPNIPTTSQVSKRGHDDIPLCSSRMRLELKSRRQNAEPVTQAAVDTEHAEMSGPTSEDRNTSSGLAEVRMRLRSPTPWKDRMVRRRRA